jgi:hypothetical protein
MVIHTDAARRGAHSPHMKSSSISRMLFPSFALFDVIFSGFISDE